MPAKKAPSSFDDMSDDVPFITSSEAFDDSDLMARKMRRYTGVF
jgi:hypothetical protein